MISFATQTAQPPLHPAWGRFMPRTLPSSLRILCLMHRRGADAAAAGPGGGDARLMLIVSPLRPWFCCSSLDPPPPHAPQNRLPRGAYDERRP